MNRSKLQQEIQLELELMEQTITELLAIEQDAQHGSLSLRDITAATAFLAQFYSGVENILKRISLFHGVPLPTGSNWHVALYKQFCHPVEPPLPLLLADPLAQELAPFRRFRHVALHGYGVQMRWERMAEGVAQVETVFEQFKIALNNYLQTLEG